MLTISDFIKQREHEWQRLSDLLNKGNLSAGEVRELGVLYRAVISDLALVRRDYPNQPVTAYINQLVTKAHGVIYRQDTTDFRAFGRYFTHTIPQVFRRTAWFTLAAFLLFIVPGVVGYRLAFVNPDVAEPLGLSGIRATLEEQEIWTEIPVEERPYASTFIMGNNIRVALLAFGGGVLFGVFTVYILITNGLIIGAVLGLATHYGLGDALWSFVIGHGFVELSVIFIAGGAGLQLGWALLNPGYYRRLDALGQAARRAVTLAVMSVPFLIAAGLIEGFISPTDLPFAVKLSVGLGSGALLYAYLLLAGRSDVRTTQRARSTVTAAP
ncbi:MAG: stage II sporulation protein M [Chloroflexi bacterium]|nr:stage II sporulation protein M [Chloroflexota bacterium]